MPQTVDRIDFACIGVDPSQWPKLSCGAANQLALQEGSLRLDAAREILFQDNGQIRAFDDSHRLVFDRANARLDLHELGDIRFFTGGPTPSERLRIGADGHVGIGTDTPTERLHVAGNVHMDGNLRITGDATMEGALNVAGAADLGTTLRVRGDAQVDGTINAAGIQQNGSPLTSSQWANVATGIHFGGGNVGIGTTSPQVSLEVAGDMKASGIIRATEGFRPATDDWEIARNGEHLEIREPEQNKVWARFRDDQSLHLIGTPNLWVDGSVGIGTTNPQQKLHVAGPYLRVDGRGNEQVYIGGDGAGNDVQLGSFNANVKNVAVWNAATNTRMNLYVNDLLHTGNVVRISDARLKANVQPLTNVLVAVEKIRSVSFEWNELYHALGATERRQEIGVLAQEVEAVFPALVSIWSNQGYKGVDYSRLAVVLLAAVKELHVELQQLKSTLA